MRTIKIIQTASQLPEKIVSNDDLAGMMDTSDEWIRSRTGILKRHIAVDETTASLAASVLQKLLKESGISADQIDFVLVATMSPDSMAPSTAAQASALAGLSNAFAMDINVACSGFVYGLTLAHGLVNTLGSHYGVVIGAETLSKLVDWQERSTAVLFGDGAAGVLVEAVDEPERLLAADLKTFGKEAKSLTAGHLWSSTTWNQPEKGSRYFQMDGHAVYSFATRQVAASIKRTFEKISADIGDTDYFLLHQANQRIIDKVADLLKQPVDCFLSNLSKYGNTSAASIPLLLDEMVTGNIVKSGQLLTFSGFGAGLSVGSIVYKY
ncbi:3-oxoacyl-ACP synthase [Oenococcus oeni]|nr:ketoacyl-ACP synthase III [Oenococcus oeni]MDI4583692.1 beta-ketoacyl-ACP synthase III [Oenococcus sp. UCMA 14587]KDP19868.1 3-oxoacyl-ACP synthase [Oenococcus oeni]KEP87218.1 3-oxoacyl-ACP synthase [Oenococcus oeni IOEB_0501]KGH58693.1 3-oxoacyl-ACP synthase [Oenococcus oeni IOEB_9805]KGH62341.1 3-oxoacyl-ACP synthase [Oenococcus oeni S13]